MRVFYHPDQRRHDPVEPHMFGGRSLPPAEVAERADRILKGLSRQHGFKVLEPGLVDVGSLVDVHSRRYLEFLRTAHERWRSAVQGEQSGEAIAYIRPLPGTPWKEPVHVLAQLGRFSNDVDPILHGTWASVLASASSASAAAAVSVRSGAAYALCRPPGHHASFETFGGYCFVNNAAVAASRLRALGCRVAILDIDTHHGNGTQSIFWNRADVLTVSIHGDPDANYPFFLGYADETGGEFAEGSNRNYPLATGSDWVLYAEALDDACRLIRSTGVDALVVALGVDTHESHGVLGLKGDDFFRIGSKIRDLGVPTVLVQEGGYAPGTLEDGVPGVLMGVLGG